jgi:hypothetical protein
MLTQLKAEVDGLAATSAATQAQLASWGHEQSQLEAEIDRIGRWVNNWGQQMGSAPTACPVPAGPASNQQGASQTFNIGTPPSAPDPWTAARQSAAGGITSNCAAPVVSQWPPGFSPSTYYGDSRSPFTEKVATMKEYQFDGGNGGARWRETIKHYLVSKAPEIDIVLRSVESHEDASARVADLVTRNLGLTEDRVRALARDLWGFMTLNLVGDARLWLNNPQKASTYGANW